MDSSIVIIGAGGHAVSVINVAISAGMSVVACVDDRKAGEDMLGIPIITKSQCLSIYPDANYAVAIGDNAIRERVSMEYRTELPNATFPSLIHQSSVVGFHARIGEGTIVMPLVNVGPNSNVDDFCILNTASSIDHDCTMRDYSSIAPRVVCGGSVEVGIRSAISIGAVVKHGVEIGKDVVVGASSYVNKRVDDNVMAYGTPCKVVRKRVQGEAYLG